MIVVIPTILLAAAWGGFAIWHQVPLAGGWLTAAVCVWGLLSAVTLILVFTHGMRRVFPFYGLFVLALLFWWSTIHPSNDRIWAADVAEMTKGAANGEIVTLDNVRNFDWRTETDFTPRWETRQFDLGKLATIDLFLSYWSSPAIAHTLVSFGFSDGKFVTFSVEIRKEKGEQFSEIGGFFKEFETSVVAADERDIIRLRTNIRGEDVYLYRIVMPKAAMRALFLAYVDEANILIETPRFYNTVTANCTTIVYNMIRHIISGLPLDYRLLFSGYLPEYIYRIGGLDKRHSLDELRQMAHINQRAIKADQDPTFSLAIRGGIPALPTAGNN
ncbi:MAG: DUF4105 domain-containing protein [Phyllobacterium sp.]